MVNIEVSARNFAFIWRLDNPVSLLEYLGIDQTTSLPTEAKAELEALEQANRDTGIRMYKLTPELREERADYNQTVIAVLQKALDDAQVTAPCREFLTQTARVSLDFGRAPEMSIPLEYCGVHLEEGRYGLFDPNAELGGIERRLLEIHDMGTQASVFPDVIKEQLELSRRWHAEYRKKYNTDISGPPK
ncbi:hypothetical protein HYX06_05045 [Candidatus Woesearchaeota archaeon]|nr:hypothetical protein [Candidatus Woesearchaeota archaeon]